MWRFWTAFHDLFGFVKDQFFVAVAKQAETLAWSQFMHYFKVQTLLNTTLFIQLLIMFVGIEPRLTKSRLKHHKHCFVKHARFFVFYTLTWIVCSVYFSVSFVLVSLDSTTPTPWSLSVSEKKVFEESRPNNLAQHYKTKTLNTPSDFFMCLPASLKPANWVTSAWQPRIYHFFCRLVLVSGRRSNRIAPKDLENSSQ